MTGRRIKRYAVTNEIPCAYCGQLITYDNVSIDHVIPRSIVDFSTDLNYIVCCRTCNSAKSSKSLEEYIIEDLDRLINVRRYLKSIEGYTFFNRKEGQWTDYSEYLKSTYKILKCKR